MATLKPLVPNPGDGKPLAHHHQTPSPPVASGCQAMSNQSARHHGIDTPLSASGVCAARERPSFLPHRHPLNTSTFLSVVVVLSLSLSLLLFKLPRTVAGEPCEQSLFLILAQSQIKLKGSLTCSCACFDSFNITQLYPLISHPLAISPWPRLLPAATSTLAPRMFLFPEAR